MEWDGVTGCVLELERRFVELLEDGKRVVLCDLPWAGSHRAAVHPKASPVYVGRSVGWL